MAGRLFHNRNAAELKTHFIIMLLLVCFQWQKGTRQQFLSNPVPSYDIQQLSAISIHYDVD